MWQDYAVSYTPNIIQMQGIKKLYAIPLSGEPLPAAVLFREGAHGARETSHRRSACWWSIAPLLWKLSGQGGELTSSEVATVVSVGIPEHWLEWTATRCHVASNMEQSPFWCLLVAPPCRAWRVCSDKATPGKCVQSSSHTGPRNITFLREEKVEK